MNDKGQSQRVTSEGADQDKGPQWSRDRFADTVSAAVPLDRGLLVRAYDFIDSYDPPEGFWGGFAASFDYIDEMEFGNDLSALYQQIIRHHLGSTFMMEDKGSSRWIYELLIGKGMPEQNVVIIPGIFDNIPLTKVSGRVVFVDDWNLSNSKVEEWMRYVISKCHVDELSAPVTMKFLYSSDYAEGLKGDARYANLKKGVISPGRVKTLSKLLNAEQFNFLKRLTSELIGPDGNEDESTSCTWGWWCIPDNVPLILTQKILYSQGLSKPPAVIFNRRDFKRPYPSWKA